LTFPAREGWKRPVGEVLQPDVRERFVRCVAFPLSGGTTKADNRVRAHFYDFDDRERKLVGAVLAQVGNPSRAVAGFVITEGMAFQIYVSSARFQEADERLEERRFSRSVWSDQADEFAFFQFKINTGEELRGTDPVAESSGAKHARPGLG